MSTDSDPGRAAFVQLITAPAEQVPAPPPDPRPNRPAGNVDQGIHMPIPDSPRELWTRAMRDLGIA